MLVCRWNAKSTNIVMTTTEIHFMWLKKLYQLTGKEKMPTEKKPKQLLFFVIQKNPKSITFTVEMHEMQS